MRTSDIIVCMCLLLCVCSLTCEGGYIRKRPADCYKSRRQCEAKCCCTGKKCKPTSFRGRKYYKCVTVDCGKLPDPANGKVITLGGTTFESLASYICNDGYILSYPAGRTCLSTCQWSGSEPVCEPEPVCGKQDCPTLEPPCNGLLVDVPANPKPGDVVSYACLEGFELDGNSNRTCQDDYTWGGISPCCVRTCRQMAEYLLPLEGSSYRQVDTPMSWVDAQENCKADGAALLELGTIEELVHITGAVDGNERWWTGGNDIAVEGVWVWPEENVTVLSGFTDWDSDGAEGGTTENCLVITGLNSKWDDNVCANMYQSICECKLSESVPVDG